MFSAVIKLGPEEARTIFAQPVTLWNQAACAAVSALHPKLKCIDANFKSNDAENNPLTDDFECEKGEAGLQRVNVLKQSP